MKKLIFFLFVFVVISLVIFNKDSDNVVIPDSAIRFRIIGNSNNINDQKAKLDIKNELFNYMASNNYDKLSRDNLINNLQNDNNISSIINKYTTNYQINYGYNYFPEKTFQGVVFNSGNYESLVITLGSGKGDNWWCFLYPPLCFIDENNIEYKSIVKNIIDNM